MWLSNLLQLLAIWTGQILPSDIPRATGWDRCTSAERDLPTTFCSPKNQLREPLSANEWLQSGSVWIYFFPWQKHSAKARSSIRAQRGGFDYHRGMWNIPKQKSPTCLQGLLKYTPETGQLKMAVRESWISCKLQAWKFSCEQPERKKLSLGDDILGLDQSLLVWHDLQCCERAFCIMVLALCICTDLLPFSTCERDRKGLKLFKIVCLLSPVNLIYQLTTSFVWLRLKYSKVSRERMAFSDSPKTLLFFSWRAKEQCSLRKETSIKCPKLKVTQYTVLPKSAGNIIQVTYKTF